MKMFKSVSKQEKAEIMIKKSRFITHVFPVEEEETAETRVNSVREKHGDATHNVFAWQIGVERTGQRFSDDGEPSGTAGRPVLEVIKNNQLTNVLVVVTRYFGGIKLGAGGLVRAYSQSAQKGLEKSGIVTKGLHEIFCVTIDYGHLGPVQRELESAAILLETNYGQFADVNFAVAFNRSEQLLARIGDLTKGQSRITKIGEKYLPLKEHFK